MPPVGFIYHEQFLDHETGHSHPENRHRLEKVYAYMREADVGSDVRWVRAEYGDEKDLLLNHKPSYIEYVKKTCLENASALLDDGDTRVCEESFSVALLAVGAAKQAVDLVSDGTFNKVFVAARPPAHHALYDHAMGFCLFNHVALATKYARDALGYEKIMIIDWDVHHGNGTQDSFYNDASVLFCSIHQYPFFPGDGGFHEKGKGEGEHYTVNIPLNEGAEIAEYREAMKNVVNPTAEAFNPDLVILSAGFDAHHQDPLANMNLNDEDFFELTRLTTEIADKYCDGKMISFLEGGYHVDALARSVVQHVTALCDLADDLNPED